MAVVLRMQRKGRKCRPFYRLVATDSRKNNQSMPLDILGTYDPLGNTSLQINEWLVFKWLRCGAQVSDTVKKLLKRSGINLHAIPAADATAPAASAKAHS